MRIMQRKALLVALSIMALMGVYACGGGGGSTPPSTSTTYEGIIVGVTGTTGQSGTLNVAIQAAITRSAPFSIIRTAHAQSSAEATATGTLTISGGGGTADLTGTFNTTTGALSLSGGGFTFAGTITSGVMSGTYTSTGGASGAFTGLNGTTNTITTICGEYEHGADTGVWNVVISSDGTASGGSTSIPPNPGVIPAILTGTLVGTTLTLTDQDGGGGTGTISGDSLTGTIYEPNGSPVGTFEGTVNGCS